MINTFKSYIKDFLNFVLQPLKTLAFFLSKDLLASLVEFGRSLDSKYTSFAARVLFEDNQERERLLFKGIEGIFSYIEIVICRILWKIASSAQVVYKVLINSLLLIMLIFIGIYILPSLLLAYFQIVKQILLNLNKSFMTIFRKNQNENVDGLVLGERIA